MRFARILTHLSTTRWKLRRLFPPAVLDAIEAEIKASEQRHEGEIRFAIEAALDLPELLAGVAPRARALQAFSFLRVWDTEHNSGVLIYLLLADRAVEIVADRGIARRVPQRRWEEICEAMRQAFRGGDFARGACDGVRLVSAVLAEHFPATGGDGNELPDRPVIL
jgi:uncharacterized membrane protein